jgi:hypothetical protein
MKPGLPGCLMIKKEDFFFFGFLISTLHMAFWWIFLRL